LAETIQTSAGALLSLVNEILDFSKIEAGKVTIERCEFDLVDCLTEAASLLAPQARAKGLEYLYQTHIGSQWVYGDCSRIRQIVLNLLSNAIKFTDRGTVTLIVEGSLLSARGAEEETTFTISVRDTGTGIAADQLPLLFREFTQLDSSLLKKHGGTGLGLAISHQLAELMGGSLTVESEPGRGSVFLLRLPLRLVRKAPGAGVDSPVEPAAADLAALSRHVLLAEDNPINRRISVCMLEKLGCRVDVAANGLEAVEKAVHVTYDLILMDCGMPEMDGLAATRKIRSGSPG
jgi:CheY-like chemotaxis protein